MKLQDFREVKDLMEKRDSICQSIENIRHLPNNAPLYCTAIYLNKIEISGFNAGVAFIRERLEKELTEVDEKLVKLGVEL